MSGTENLDRGEYFPPRTFQFTVDSAADMEAFRALADSRGILWEEVPNPASDDGGTPLSFDTLNDISQQYWDTSIYGHTAVNILTAEQQGLRGTIHHMPNPSRGGQPMLAMDARRGLHLDGLIQSSPIGTIEAAVRQEIAKRGVPFGVTFLLAPQGPFEKDTYQPLLFVQPGKVTLEALEAYIKKRGYAEHRLHGSLGRALDVLCLAVEAIRTPRVPEEPPDVSALISPREIDRGITERTIGTSRIEPLRARMANILYRQLRDGRADSDGELVAEGACDIGWRDDRNREPHFDAEYFVRSSLARVALDFGPGRRTPLRSYLEAIAAGAA